MRYWMLGVLFVLAISYVFAAESVENPPLEWYPQNCSKLERVTYAPLKMSPMVAMACASIATTITNNSSDKFFDVYISGCGESIIRSGKGTYPEGTVILKRKYSDDAGKNVELYTGMVKRAKGYNPTGGDWEYFSSTADGKITGHGALANCMSCHQSYSSSDYVTRAYFVQPSSYSPASGETLEVPKLSLQPPTSSSH